MCLITTPFNFPLPDNEKQSHNFSILLGLDVPREEEARGKADVQERADRYNKADEQVEEVMNGIIVSAEHINDQHGMKWGCEQVLD